MQKITNRLMKFKKISASFRTFLVILLFLTSHAFAKQLSIENAEVKYELLGNSYVKVTETVDYTLICDSDSDKFTELFRQLPKGLPLTNQRARCLTQNCKFRYDEVGLSGDPELVLELENGCGKVSAVFEYNVYVLIEHEDTIQFYYKLWGENSPSPNHLRATVTLPGSVEQTDYFIHPWGADVIDASSGKNIILTANNYPSQTYLEINILMPKQWFANANKNFFINGTSNRQEIINNERNDEFIRTIIMTLIIILGIALLVSPWFFGILFYFLHGREYAPSDLGYTSIYEREPPTRHTPAEAPSFVEGDYDLNNAFQATIVSLAAKKWLQINKKGKDYVMVLKNKGSSITTLEKKVYDKIANYSKNNELSVDYFKNQIASKKEFYYWHKQWLRELKSLISLSNYVDSKGTSLFTGVMLIMFVIGFISFFIIDFLPLPEDIIAIINVFLIGWIVSCVVAYIIFSKKKIWLSRWNKKGRMLNLQWSNFRKYLQDYSLLKMHPPQSVAIWEHYLAYAVGFGVAKQTIKAMEKINPSFIEKTSTFNTFACYYVFIALTPSYTPQTSSASGFGGWSGGFSGAGGGFGGGGFGGR